MLKTSLEKGIPEDEDEVLKRQNGFGANTYPRKKGRSFFVRDLNCYGYCFLFVFVFNGSLLLQMFLWEAWQDLTLIILIVAAVASLALGIKSEVSKELLVPY